MSNQPLAGWWSAGTDAEFDAFFVREYGSFLRNVRPGVPGVCGVCMTPVSAGYLLCRPCSQIVPADVRSSPSMLTDRRAFLTYAVEGGQAYSVLKGYKNPRPADRYWVAAATWVVWFLTRHGHCAHRLAGYDEPDWLWATVPSARSGRAGEHPLHRLVARVWGADHGEARLALAPGAEGQARGYHPGKFSAAALPPGSHVILIDDSPRPDRRNVPACKPACRPPSTPPPGSPRTSPTTPTKPRSPTRCGRSPKPPNSQRCCPRRRGSPP